MRGIIIYAQATVITQSSICFPSVHTSHKFVDFDQRGGSGLGSNVIPFAPEL